MMGVFGEASAISKSGFVFVVASFFLQLIGFATPYWLFPQNNKDKLVYYGLWQACQSRNGERSCTNICNKECPYLLKGAQITATLGFIVLLAAVVFVALKMLKTLKNKHPVIIAAIVCCLFGGVFALTGAILFATQPEMKAEYLHFSFAFCILAAVGSFTSGILHIIGK